MRNGLAVMLRDPADGWQKRTLDAVRQAGSTEPLIRRKPVIRAGTGEQGRGDPARCS